MKKLIYIIIVILLFCMSSFTYANDEYKIISSKVFFDNQEKELENPLILVNDKMYVSLRELCELLEINVNWNSKEKTVNINLTEDTELYAFGANGFYGYKDRQGNVIINPQYYYTEDFCNGLGLVRKSGGQNGEYGFVNSKGEEVIPCIYYKADSFSEGVAMVKLGENSYGDRISYINTKGELIFDKIFEYGRNFSDGYAVVLKEGQLNPTASGSHKLAKFGYINTKGEFATSLSFEFADDFCHGYAIVAKDGKYGVVDKNFKFVIPCEYDFIENENGRFIVTTMDSKDNIFLY